MVKRRPILMSEAERIATATEDPCPSWTIGQGLTETEARACERALSELPGVEPVDEVARRRLEATRASVASSVTVSEDGRKS